MRIHKVSPCLLLLELFFFLLVSLMHYEWMPFGLNSSLSFCQKLLPRSWLLSQEQCLMTLLCMPSLSVWAFALAVISTTFITITAIIIKAIETPPIPNGLWWFQCLRAKPLHYNFHRDLISEIPLDTSFLRRNRYIRTPSYNLTWNIIYQLWWCTYASCIRAYLAAFKSKA